VIEGLLLSFNHVLYTQTHSIVAVRTLVTSLSIYSIFKRTGVPTKKMGPHIPENVGQQQIRHFLARGPCYGV